MKAVKIIIEILAALAAIAGIVYVIANYGDKIVAWARKLIPCNGCPCDCDCECECDCDCECDCECADEAVEEAPVSEDTVVAAESDFEGE